MLGVEHVDVVIETPAGSRNKYEFDTATGQVRFARRLPGSVAFPADYGFLPGTRGTDGEPLDALVLLTEPTYPGVYVSARPIGVVWIRTGSGRREAKIVCIPHGEPAYEAMVDIEELPKHLISEVTNFFEIYRMLDSDASTSYDGLDGADAAHSVIVDASVRCADTTPR